MPVWSHLTLQYASLFHIFVIIASFIIMIKAADLLVFGISDYAKKLGLSDYLIGLVVVSIGSSMPELVSSIIGSTMDEGGIIFGTIIGSNIATMTLVVGMLAIAARKMKTECKILEGAKIDFFILLLLPFILIIDGRLSRIDGVILVSAYFIHLYMLWKKEGEVGKIKKDIKLDTVYRDVLIFVGCLVALLLSGRYLVFSSVNLARDMGISPYYIALVVIGIGCTMPDISLGIKAVVRKHQDIGFGNVLGGTTLKALLFLGVLSIINPIHFEFRLLVVSMMFMLFIIGLILLFVEQKEINWREGVILIFLYFFFIIVEWMFG